MESLFQPNQRTPGPQNRSGITPAKLEILAAFDLLAAFVALTAPILLRYGTDAPPEHVLTAMRWAPLFLAWRLAAAHGFGLHDLRRRLTISDHVFAGIGAALVGVVPGYLFLALLQLYYEPIAQFSRVVAVMDAGFLVLWYAGSRALALALLRRAGWRLRVLVAGPSAEAGVIADEIRTHGPGLVEVAGTVELGDDADALLREWVEPNRVEVIVLATSAVSSSCLAALVAGCDRRGVEVCVNPDIQLALVAGADVFSLAGLPLVRLSPNAARSGYGAVKRAFDVLVSAPGLVLAAPFILMAALLIRLSSKGSAFYVQERVGRFGKPFRLHKLRTMIVGAEDTTGPVLAAVDDPRVTPVGRLLRRVRIDELPQLWNVLRGEMSLVGPRPERPEFARDFVKEEPLYLHRLLVRPGLTGLAQIHGRYDTDYRQKLRYDLIYLNVMSARADLRILAATVRIALTGRGAV